MARISGVDLEKNKRVDIALTRIYGIGRVTSTRVLVDANVDPTTRVHALDETQVAAIRKVIDTDCKVEGELRKDVSLDIKRLMDMGCYRGIRHRKSLPVRGQRTSTNARTRKGPKKGAVAKKKKA